MTKERFWYVAGTVIGIILKLSIYIAGIYGTITMLINHEIPYLPVILMFVFHAWSRIIGTYELLVQFVNYQLSMPKKLSDDEINTVANIISYRNMFGGGPN